MALTQWLLWRNLDLDPAKPEKVFNVNPQVASLTSAGCSLVQSCWGRAAACGHQLLGLKPVHTAHPDPGKMRRSFHWCPNTAVGMHALLSTVQQRSILRRLQSTPPNEHMQFVYKVFRLSLIAKSSSYREQTSWEPGQSLFCSRSQLKVSVKISCVLHSSCA